MKLNRLTYLLCFFCFGQLAGAHILDGKKYYGSVLESNAENSEQEEKEEQQYENLYTVNTKEVFESIGGIHIPQLR